jgi:hypothetical protein
VNIFKIKNLGRELMNKTLMLFFTFILLFGCGKDEPKFEAFNPEAFAYDLGESWEVNSTTNIRGFKQQRSDEIFSASISYSVDLETPAGEIVKSVFEHTEEKTYSEELLDMQLESQFGLDTSYTVGKYNLIYKILDNFGGKETEIKVGFELSK